MTNQDTIDLVEFTMVVVLKMRRDYNLNVDEVMEHKPGTIAGDIIRFAIDNRLPSDAAFIIANNIQKGVY